MRIGHSSASLFKGAAGSLDLAVCTPDTVELRLVVGSCDCPANDVRSGRTLTSRELNVGKETSEAV